MPCHFRNTNLAAVRKSDVCDMRSYAWRTSHNQDQSCRLKLLSFRPYERSEYPRVDRTAVHLHSLLKRPHSELETRVSPNADAARTARDTFNSEVFQTWFIRNATRYCHRTAKQGLITKFTTMRMVGYSSDKMVSHLSLAPEQNVEHKPPQNDLCSPHQLGSSHPE